MLRNTVLPQLQAMGLATSDRNEPPGVDTIVASLEEEVKDGDDGMEAVGQ